MRLDIQLGKRADSHRRAVLAMQHLLRWAAWLQHRKVLRDLVKRARTLR